jgi:hypothetical protein
MASRVNAPEDRSKALNERMSAEHLRLMISSTGPEPRLAGSMPIKISCLEQALHAFARVEIPRFHRAYWSTNDLRDLVH